jgi:hypothetical protein
VQGGQERRPVPRGPGRSPRTAEASPPARPPPAGRGSASGPRPSRRTACSG